MTITPPTPTCAISVIMPVYNCATTVKKAINSILTQTIRDVEIVVVDDGSSDGTPAIVAELAANHPIKLICLEQNVGVGEARRLALAHCKGRWITMLDADDWYKQNRLETLLKTAESMQADLVCDNLSIYDHALQQIVGTIKIARGRKVTQLTGRMLLDREGRRHPLGLAKPMVRAGFIRERSITYDPRYRVGEDFLFFADILFSGAKAFVVPNAAYVYVLQTSPSKGTASPHSRTNLERSNMMSIYDDLMAKHSATLSSADKKAFRKAKARNRALRDYLEAVALKQTRDYRAVVRLLRRKPNILLFKLHLIKCRLQDSVMVHRARLLIGTNRSDA